VESSLGPCPDRRGRNGLGVAGRCECTGEGVALPGEHARGREGVACASLVGETEREWGARGGLPRGLPEQGRREGDRVHPWGFQVGSQGQWGAHTRLASGQEVRVELEEILARSCACMARVSSSPSFS
jgi:hypothetical protein